MPFPDTLVIKVLLNLGVLVEQSLVFLESLEEEHTDLAKELLEICAEEVECLLQPESGEDGTEESTSTKDVQQQLPPSQPLLYLP